MPLLLAFLAPLPLSLVNGYFAGFVSWPLVRTMPKRPARKAKLTEFLVKRAQPAAVVYSIWDANLRGLVLRVHPTGRRTWIVIYRSGGRPRWLHLGDATAIGLADARELAAEAMLQVARGHDPAAERRALRSRGTFGEIASRYVEDYAKRNNKSWKQPDALVRRHLLPRWGKLQVSTITRADVKAMMARVTAPTVANQTLMAASAIFNWAIKEELTTSNPCRGIERNPTASRERVLSDSEIPKFWTAFDDAGLVTGTALKMVLLTGQRPGEVAHMRHEHIVDGWWELPGAPVPVLGWPGTKNGENHRVWLPTPAQELLAELSDDENNRVLYLPVSVVARAASWTVPCVLSALRSEQIERHRTICGGRTAPLSPRSASVVMR